MTQVEMLVVGGAASGKSAFAESEILRCSGLRYCIAAVDFDAPDAHERIARIESLRENNNFILVEIEGDLELALNEICSRDVNVLFGDLATYVAGKLYEGGRMHDPYDVFDEVMEDIATLSKHCRNLIVVGNEVGLDGISYGRAERTFVGLLGKIQCTLARDFETVVEVAAGLPQVLKGELFAVGTEMGS